MAKVFPGKFFIFYNFGHIQGVTGFKVGPKVQGDFACGFFYSLLCLLEKYSALRLPFSLFSFSSVPQLFQNIGEIILQTIEQLTQFSYLLL